VKNQQKTVSTEEKLDIIYQDCWEAFYIQALHQQKILITEQQKDCWEAFYIQALHQQKILISEQQISDVNSLFELAKVTNTLRLKP